MPSSLLPSQLADLEPLADDEDGVTVTSRPAPEQTLGAILAALETADAAGNATTSTAGNATTSTITSTAASASAGL